MRLDYENLDDRTRRYMLEEVEMDVSNGNLYLSPRLTAKGKQIYASLLKEAVYIHDDDWLAESLGIYGCLGAHQTKRKPSGGLTFARVPSNATKMLAEGEFNRFYIRGLCKRAVEDGISEVEVYRARASRTPRSKSAALIGKRIEVKLLLEDLRTSQGRRPKLGVPGGPNSGLSVRLPLNA